MKVGVVTTSFPLTASSSSGAFILKLVLSVSQFVRCVVVTPCGTCAVTETNPALYQIRCFRYAPRRWQVLAHQPGGIPAALDQHTFIKLLIAPFLLALFVACLRLSRTVDILHANWSINGAIAGIAGLLTRTPVVTTLRGTDVARAECSRMYRFVLGLCVRLSKNIVAVSDDIATRVCQLAPLASHKVVVIPNGVDESLLRFAPNTNVHRFHLLTVAALVANKGIDVVLAALRSCPNCILTIAGGGPEEVRLRSLIDAYGLHNHVNMLGAVSMDAIPALLREANAFVLASYSEGRPNAILEAMAAGVPVIASNIGGIDELIEDGTSGLLFAAGDPVALQEKILRLQNDPVLRKNLARAARGFIVSQKLTWERTASDYINLYKKVLSGE